MSLSFFDWPHTLAPSVLGLHSVTHSLPDKSHLYLNALGVAGVFGGDEAVSAMATVHVYENSPWWLGWHNNPGSYKMAARFALLVKSRFLDRHYPGIHTDPATLFESDASKGPMFRAAHSGITIKETSHMAALLMEECATQRGEIIRGRNTQIVDVTIAELKDIPTSQMYPRHTNIHAPIFSSMPVVVSVGTCIACILFKDWYSSSLIFSGMLASGISSLTIRSGKLAFTHPRPHDHSPPGDGILGSGTEIVLLKGPEGAVNAVTRGRFSLNFSSEYQFKNIGRCSALLRVQSIIQLVLAPKCSLFGQIMFATSLGVSWICNLWLSSLCKKEIQREILLNNVLGAVLTKYTFDTRTTAVVFILLVLQPEEPNDTLNELLPHDSKVWRQWKRMVLQRLLAKENRPLAEEDLASGDFTERERTSLKALYADAQAAFDTYDRYVSSRKHG